MAKTAKRAARGSTRTSAASRTSSRRPRERAWGGFTIAELLVVMVLIAVLAGMAMPSFMSG
ncbi:MAG TPA: prepilin-type N-terminal cleavage/methylation domain-containing protein, partial [Armatimonadota bacterium]|nr:prepilin-type N-terminal cleavage/methylation domain-containing protein [Armatimonadota bacterium]